MDEAQFLRDVGGHQMTVFKEEGVYRHLRFSKPDSSIQHFDLLTWPGYLCYTGDMGTYVFQRTEDMFTFFRTNPETLKDGCTLGINPGYWEEKIQARDRHHDVKEFSEETFERVVLEHLVEWIRDNAYRTTKEERRQLWDEVKDRVLCIDCDYGGYSQQIAAHDFRHRVNDELEFQFQDFWECSVDEYTELFLWCCYAITWGISVYDAQTTSQGEQGQAE